MDEWPLGTRRESVFSMIENATIGGFPSLEHDLIQSRTAHCDSKSWNQVNSFHRFDAESEF